MKFIKMHGAGNDYIYINCFQEEFTPSQEAVKKLCDRHCGIGGDGVVLLLPSEKADLKMRIFNADGSEGKTCGNALRCIGVFLFGENAPSPLKIETLAGIKTVTKSKNGVSVFMGEASFESKKVPCAFGVPEVVEKSVIVEGEKYSLTCLSTGNPHAVIFSENSPCDCPVEKVGGFFDKSSFFPEGVNTSFAQIIDEKTIKACVYERGSGITLACGSAACAIAAAAKRGGKISSDEIRIIMPGGDLFVSLKGEDMLLSGDAEVVFKGEIS